MAITISTVMRWCGITVVAQQRIVIADLAPNPGGLGNLVAETESGIKDACLSYTKLQPEDTRFRLSRVVVKRLVNLMLWAKDRHRLNESVEFENGTTLADFLVLIEEARVRADLRKVQAKAGEALITSDFVQKLKNATQWERWNVELKAILNSIIGSKGIPIAYVIRENPDVELDGFATWELKAYNGATLAGPEYRSDCKLVHQIIIKNIADDSDAYTYIKPQLRHEDGRRDIIALRNRYSNNAVKQERINEANKTITSLVYKSERSLPFEKFSGKLQRAVDTLTECDRAPHNGDIVDSLWSRIQNPELQPFLQALKVQYSIAPRPFSEVLQDIAAQIPTLEKGTFTNRRNLSDCTTGQKLEWTKDGDCPDKGAITGNGKLFIGNYPGKKWNHPDVRPYHRQIREARDGNSKGGHSQRGKNRFSKKGAKRKIAQLKATIKSMESQKDGNVNSDDVKSSDAGNAADSGSADKAGNAFGGRTSKSTKNN